MSKRIIHLDFETGEVLEGTVAFLPPRKRNGFHEGWLAMSQDALKVLARERKNIGSEGYAVLMELISRLPIGGDPVPVNQGELSQTLAIDRGNVSRALKRLVRLGALVEGPTIGKVRTYTLAPTFGWKGDSRAHVIALDAYRRAREKQNHE